MQQFRVVSEYGLYCTFETKLTIFRSFIPTNNTLSALDFLSRWIHFLLEKNRPCLGSPASHTFSPLGSSRASSNTPHTDCTVSKLNLYLPSSERRKIKSGEKNSYMKGRGTLTNFNILTTAQTVSVERINSEYGLLHGKKCWFFSWQYPVINWC